MNMDLENQIAAEFVAILDKYATQVSGSTMVGILETLKLDLLTESKEPANTETIKWTS